MENSLKKGQKKVRFGVNRLSVLVTNVNVRDFLIFMRVLNPLGPFLNEAQ